jgi:urease accessory protein
LITLEKKAEVQTNSWRVRGKLHLGFDYDPASGQTRLKLLAQQPPLRVVRAFDLPQGGALVHLHNVSGGVLGGDHLELKVEIGPGASVKVGEGSLLEFLAEPLIPFAGSRYSQRASIELAPGAGLFWWETVAPGREAMGELFKYDCFQSNLEISLAERPLALERLRLEPGKVGLDALARLGPYRYFSSFYICRVGLTRPGESLWGISTLPAHGLVVRALCQTGRELAPGLFAFWQAAKRALYQQEARLPRKIY